MFLWSVHIYKGLKSCSIFQKKSVTALISYSSDRQWHTTTNGRTTRNESVDIKPYFLQSLQTQQSKYLDSGWHNRQSHSSSPGFSSSIWKQILLDDLWGPFQFWSMIVSSLKLHTLYQMGCYCIELICHLIHTKLQLQGEKISFPAIHIHPQTHS